MPTPNGGNKFGKRNRKAPLDFDGDGVSELGIRMGDTVDLYAIGGDAVAQQSAQFTNSNALPFFAPADYTGDGNADAAYVEITGGGLVWDMPVQNSSNSRRVEIFGKAGDIFISGCYFDQDPFADRVSIGRKSAAVQVSSGGQIKLRVPGIRRGRQVFCADTDGDGIDELIVSTQEKTADGKAPAITSTKTQLYSVSIDGTLRKLKRARTFLRLVAFDMNGDGADEIGLYRPGYSTLKVIVSGLRRPVKLIVPSILDLTGATIMTANGEATPGLLITDPLGNVYRVNLSTMLSERIAVPQSNANGLLVPAVTVAR